MIRFRNFKIRTKLGVVFTLIVVPLLVGEIISVVYFKKSLTEAAQLKLDNIVHHLYLTCEMFSAREYRNFGNIPAAPDGPDPETFKLLRGLFINFKISNSGYPYVMDVHGNLIIHPQLEGQNIFDREDLSGFRFIEEITKNALKLGPREVGVIRYPWTNISSERTEPSYKITKYMFFRKWGWIIAVGDYEQEVYQSLVGWRKYALFLIGITLLLVVGLTTAFNRILTAPIMSISEAASKLAAGDLRARVKVKPGKDEIVSLGESFNWMGEQVLEKNENLSKIVEERTRELAESREKYRSLVESTVDGVVTANMEGTVTFVNSGLEKMLGLTRDKVVGRKIWEFYADGVTRAREVKRMLLEHQNISNYEMLLNSKTGQIPIMVSASLLRDSEGEIIGTLGVFADISQMKELEEELQRAQLNLIQTMKLRALGDLVAGVAHEINNPLMASSTMLHVLTKSLTDSEHLKYEKHLNVLARCNERIAGIINHLREFSREAKFKKDLIDINEPLKNALLISNQQFLNMQIEVMQSLADNLPKICGDPNYFEQVFLDLLANARDALENTEGRRKIVITTGLSSMEDSPAVQIVISDNGIGIPAEIKDKIFEPFFTTKGVGKGTGLGLPIVYGIIEEHGGHITVESEQGDGATFKIIIPIYQEKEEAENEH